MQPEHSLPATAEDVARLCEEDPDLAAASLHELTVRSEGDDAALRLASYGFHVLDRHDVEVETLERLIRLEPGAWGSRMILGDALMEVGREQDARQAFRIALKLCEDPVDVAKLARVVADWELYDLCVDVTRYWIVLESRSTEAHGLLGVSLGMTGDHAAAVRAFEVAGALEPGNRRYRQNLSYALAREARMLEGWRAFWNRPVERIEGPRAADLFDEPVEMEWSSVGDELIRRVSYEAEDRLPLLGSELGWHDSRAHAFVINFRSPALRTRLVIEPKVRDVRFRIESVDGTPVQDCDLMLWRSMVTNCLDALGEDRALPWFALIGTVPASRLEVSEQQLIASGRLGDLELHPCPRVQEHAGIPALRNETVRHISPIAVEGVCHGFHDWGVDAEEEGLVLGRLCAFLSLVWNSAWEMKVAPQPGYADDLVEKRDVSVIVQDDDLHTAVGAVQLEPWMEHAFERLSHDEALRNAAHAFHEGMLLLERHPSVAAMRFVTCCEVLGGRLDPRAGSGARVRATFESRLDHDDAEELWHAYKRRNETAHEATYHGLELSEGLGDLGFFEEHLNGLAFPVGLLNRLRSVTRDALLGALR